MKTETCMLQGLLMLLLVSFIQGCGNAERTEEMSSTDASSTPADHSEFNEQPQTLKFPRLEKDLRPEIEKQIYGTSDQLIALAEQFLSTLGVNRRYNITGSFVGGINKLDLEILPNASGNASKRIQIYFHPGPKILGGTEHVLEWLELDDRLLETENLNGEYAE